MPIRVQPPEVPEALVPRAVARLRSRPSAVPPPPPRRRVDVRPPRVVVVAFEPPRVAVEGAPGEWFVRALDGSAVPVDADDADGLRALAARLVEGA